MEIRRCILDRDLATLIFLVMMRAFPSLTKAACLFSCVLPLATAALHQRYSAERDNILYNVIEDHSSGAKLEFVKNSGICETTPGVNSYSGYLTVGHDMNMFFWYAPTIFVYKAVST